MAILLFCCVEYIEASSTTPKTKYDFEKHDMTICN